MIGHNPELKGDVHPIHCPVYALGEVKEEYIYGKASRTADVTVGEIKINHDSQKCLLYFHTFAFASDKGFIRRKATGIIDLSSQIGWVLSIILQFFFIHMHLFKFSNH